MTDRSDLQVVLRRVDAVASTDNILTARLATMGQMMHQIYIVHGLADTDSTMNVCENMATQTSGSTSLISLTTSP